MPRPTLINLTLYRTGDKTVIQIKAAKELEAFFSDLSKGEGSEPQYLVSQNWKDKEGNNAKFYKMTDTMEAKLAQWLENNSAFNNAGGSILVDSRGRVNMAILRAVGITGGTTISFVSSELSDNFELEDYVRSVANVSKKIYAAFISKSVVKATITLTV